MANTTLDDKVLEGTFLMNDFYTPAFWMWSFRLSKEIKVCDGVRSVFSFFVILVLIHSQCMTAAEIASMRAEDVVFHGDDGLIFDHVPVARGTRHMTLLALPHMQLLHPLLLHRQCQRYHSCSFLRAYCTIFGSR